MATSRDGTARIYDFYAGIYDHLFGRFFRRAREELLHRLPIEEGERVLEVGVGTGLCLPLYPEECDVVGIDVSSGMLRKAADRVEKLGLSNVELLAMDAGDMSFPDSSFDLVIAVYVVTAVPEYRRLMREMVRVSRPGGRVVLLNHFTQDSAILSALERAVSPLCARIGFRTDLSVDDVVDGWPLITERDERTRPLGIWHVVECVNDKPG